MATQVLLSFGARAVAADTWICQANLFQDGPVWLHLVAWAGLVVSGRGLVRATQQRLSNFEVRFSVGCSRPSCRNCFAHIRAWMIDVGAGVKRRLRLDLGGCVVFATAVPCRTRILASSGALCFNCEGFWAGGVFLPLAKRVPAGRS